MEKGIERERGRERERERERERMREIEKQRERERERERESEKHSEGEIDEWRGHLQAWPAKDCAVSGNSYKKNKKTDSFRLNALCSSWHIVIDCTWNQHPLIHS